MTKEKQPPAKQAAAQVPVDMDVVLLRDGVKACGQYKHGVVYSVAGKEGQRLIDVKGFTKATAAVKEQLTKASEA